MRIKGFVAEVDKPEGREVKPVGPGLEALPIKEATANVDISKVDAAKPVKHIFAEKKVSNTDADNAAEIAVEFPGMVIEYTYEFNLA